MRRSEVQSRFFKEFDELYPQFRFRALHLLHRDDGDYDFSLSLQVGQVRQWVDMRFIVLTEGTSERVSLYLDRVRADGQNQWLPAFLAPGFASEALALIERAGLAHFDLRGNVYLVNEGIYVDVSGRPNPLAPKENSPSPFEGKRERIVRRLLMDPEKTWHMRELASAAEVSLGLASMTTSDMEKEPGGLNKRRVGLSVHDPAAILDAWIRSYDLHRSPFTTFASEESLPVLVRRLAMMRDTLEEQLAGQIALTLWPAAEIYLDMETLAPHLAVYWTGRSQALARALGWSQERGGTRVFVFQPYDKSVLWGRRRTPDDVPIVSALQLYLDLASGDERELGIAQELRSRVLGW